MAFMGRSRAGRLLPVSCFGIVAAAGVAHAELRLSEVMPNGSGANEADEWIEVYNAGADAIDLSAYRIGDEETVGGGEGFYAFPAATLDAGDVLVVTRNATAFAAAFTVPQGTAVFASAEAAQGFALTKDTALGSGEIGLGNGASTTGDEVLLLKKIADGQYTLVDGVSYGGANAVTSYTPPGGSAVTFIDARVATVPGELQSLARISAVVDADLAADWHVLATPTPGTVPTNVCGNAVLEDGETCDDGNDDPDDGCDAGCLAECGYTCVGVGPGSCGEDCGDGDVAGLEECDDGDALPGDGCDASCRIEDGWACPEPEPLCDGNSATASACTLDPCLLPLVITEVHADAFVDPDGEWIELTNDSAVAIDLSPWSFGDQPTQGAGAEGMIRFDAGRTLAPGARIVLAQNGARFAADTGAAPTYEYGVDSASTAPYLHRVSDWAPNTNIQLDNAEDQVVLACGGALRDVVRWGAGGLDDRVTVHAPSADYSNADPDAGPLTFERLADARSGTAADWTVSACPSPGDAPASRPPEAAGTLVTVPSGVPTVFTLPAFDPDGDAITYDVDLTGLAGTLEVIAEDTVRYTPPAGSGALTTRFSFTAADACAASAPAVVELVVGPASCSGALDAVRITEVHSDARVDNDGEWIELTNTGATTVDLGYLRVGDEETEGGSEGMVLFRPGTLLAPGDALVVAFSAAAFEDDWDLVADGEWYRDSDGVINELPRAAWATGAIRLDNGADGVVLLDCDDAVIDSVYWGREATGADPVEAAWSQTLRPTPAWDGVSAAGPATFARRDPDEDTDSAADWFRELCPTPGRATSDNGAPVAVDAVYAVGTNQNLSRTLSASDPDGDPLTFSATADGGTVSVTGSTGAFTFSSPTAGYFVIAFEASDGCASASGTVRVCVAANPATCDLTCDPTKPDVCDGKDNDCDPATADGSGDPALGSACDSPADADGCTDEVRVCQGGALGCPNVATGDAARVEVCDANNVDEDCDGGADDNDPQGNATGKQTFFRDLDGDGRGRATPTQQRCDAGGGYVLAAGDCDDDPAACGNRCSPALVESQALGNCNDHRDNDCDGATDTDASCGDDILCYFDRDGDGFGRFDSEIVVSGPAAAGGCAGYDDGQNPLGSWVVNGLDCDDEPAGCGAGCHPGADELCDEEDNDCDAGTADGSGDALVGVACDAAADSDRCRDDRSTCDAGAVVCQNLATTDAAQVEVCDAADVDEDCDGGADDADPEGVPNGAPSWFRDRDGDGYGDALVSVRACARPSGYAPNDLDCDDEPTGCGAGCHPGADDVCDALDNDCDVLTPDGHDDVLVGAACDSEADADRCLDEITVCVAGGRIACDNDPDGDTARVEVCDPNDVDEDCDGGADDADPDGEPPGSRMWYADADGDGHGDAAGAIACDPPAGAVTVGDDCDDDPDACGAGCFPGNTESPAAGTCADGYDNDCDGSTDTDPGCTGATTCYADRDEDGFGDDDTFTNVAPVDLPAGGCAAWDDGTHAVGYWTGVAGDCADQDAALHPGATDVVGNDVDEDCNGALRCWVDDDNDNYARDDAPESDAPAGEGCAEAFHLASLRGDCEDDSEQCGAACSPAAIEICDGFDNDCDSRTDELEGCEQPAVGVLGGGQGCAGGGDATVVGLLGLAGLAGLLRGRRRSSLG